MKRHIWLVVALLAQISCVFTLVQGAKWRTIETAGDHAAREETTFSPCGGTNICLLGGRGMAPTPVLDTATLQWTNGPAPPIELHHFQGAVGPDGCAWIFGAWTGPFPNEVAVKDIYRYCADTSEWSVVGKMRRARGAGATVFHQDHFYVATGNVGGHTVSAQTVNWFEKYNPVTKVWTVLPNVPHPRDHVGAAIFRNKLYLAGGRDSGGADYPDFFKLTEPKVDVYDFNTETWYTMKEDFPAPRAGASVAIYKGSMWVAGGEGSGKAWDEVEILSNSRLDTRFKDGPKMPHPRHGFGMVSCNGVLWVAGGAGTEGGGASQTMLDAYYSGSKPKACRISVTAAPTVASTAIPTAPPKYTTEPPLEEEVAPVPEPEPSAPPVSQPPPASMPYTGDELAITPGTSTLSPKDPEENQHPPSSTIATAPPKSDTKKHLQITETTPEPSIESADASSDTTLYAGISDIFSGNDNENGNKGISDDEESDDSMVTGVDLAPKKNDGGENRPSLGEDDVDIDDDAPLYSGERDGVNNENANTFLSPDMLATPEIPVPTTEIPVPTTEIPELNFSLDDVPTLISFNDIPYDDASLTPEPGLEGVPVEVDDGASDKACFPGHATVRLHDGTMKNMDDLQTGDRVLVAHPDRYSEVFFFSHKQPHHISNFVSLKTDNEFSIHVSARHLVYANGELTEARHVRVGDVLSIAHHTKTARVTTVNRIAAKGLYNPHTLHGDIVVDNIAASTLTRTLHPSVAKAFLIPFNAAYRALGPHEYIDTLNRQVLQALDYFVW